MVDKAETPKTYRSLEDLPAWNFYQIRKNGDFRYLYKLEEYYDLEEIEPGEELPALWSDLFDQYIDTFGLGKEYKEALELRREIVILQAEVLMTKNTFLNNKIRHKQMRLDELTTTKDEQKISTFEEQVIALERWRKMPIDSKTITCVRFFYLMKQMNEEARKNQITNLMKSHG